MRRLIAGLLKWLLVRTALFRARVYYLLGGITAVAALVPRLSKHQLTPVLRRYGASIGEQCDVCDGLRIHNAKQDFGNLTVGHRVHLGPETFLDLTAEIRIGDGATVSMRSTILTHIDVGASPLAELGFGRTAEAVEVGAGAYLGACCVVLMGSRIGREAVIGAGSLVRGEVPDRAVAVGSPARVVRRIGSPGS